MFAYPFYPSDQYPKFGSKEYAEVSYQTACESVTLLKNQNTILPLTNTKEKIFVCGPSANSLNLLNGGWTHTWQGVDTLYNTKNKLSILQALRNNFGNNQILYAKGSSTDSLIDLQNCINQAAKADKIIVCLGEIPCTELPGNIDDLSLPKAQNTLVTKLLALNKPLILVCCFNRPRIIHDIVPASAAVIYAYLPGDEGGRAIADCISGKINPSGKLPFTYPKSVNDFVHYDHKTTEELSTDFSMNGYQPEFDFGFGLSYTNFTYSAMEFSKTTLSGNDSVEVSITITNAGKRAGKEVVQLYYKDLFASITPPVKKLCNFQKVELNSGESKKIRFILKKEDFSFINKALQRVTEAGEIEIQISNQHKRIYVN